MPVESTFGKKFLFKSIDYFELPLVFDFIYPEDIDVYYEDYREGMKSREKFSIFFIWLTKIWIECNGNHIGTLTTTEENSVRRIFNLNKIHWVENIDYPTWGEQQQFQITRELTSYEIKQRINFNYFPKYKTVWRYLKKGTQFAEFGIYNYQLYHRSGFYNDFSSIPFEKYEEEDYFGNIRKYVSTRIDELYNDDYFEELRPSMYPRIFSEMIELELQSNSKEEKIKPELIENLEYILNIEIPECYKYFITKIYDKDIGKQIVNFPVALNRWGRIDKYLKPDEIFQKIKDIKYLNVEKCTSIPFAITTTNSIICLGIESESVFMLDGESKVMLNKSLENFLNSCITISEYFCPRKVHIEKGNISTIKKWINEGWDMNDVKTGNRSILNLSYNDELNIMLLKNGADPNKTVVYHDITTPKYLKALIEHGLDLEKKFEENKWLKPKLKERKGFEKILSKY